MVNEDLLGLVGMKVHITIIEPYEAATPTGGRPHRASIDSFGTARDGGVYADFVTDGPLQIEHEAFSELLAAPHHSGTAWNDLLKEGFLAVGLGTSRFEKAPGVGDILPTVIPGKLVAMQDSDRQRQSPLVPDQPWAFPRSKGYLYAPVFLSHLGHPIPG